MNLAGWFAAASAFQKTGDIIKNKELLISPYVVNTAFACELYLKGLLLVEGSTDGILTGKKAHRLCVLFNKLNKETRELLISETMKHIKGDDKLFDDYLCEISNAFIEWRYYFEKQRFEVISEEEGKIRMCVSLPAIQVSTEFLDYFARSLSLLSLQKEW